jgi:hypothetical protein
MLVVLLLTCRRLEWAAWGMSLSISIQHRGAGHTNGTLSFQLLGRAELVVCRVRAQVAKSGESTSGFLIRRVDYGDGGPQSSVLLVLAPCENGH